MPPPDRQDEPAALRQQAHATLQAAREAAATATAGGDAAAALMRHLDQVGQSLDHWAEAERAARAAVQRQLLRERLRGDFLSRRLHTLYTRGPRRWLSRLMALADRLGLARRYETWEELRERMDRRLRERLKMELARLAYTPTLTPDEPAAPLDALEGAPVRLGQGVPTGVTRARTDPVRVCIASLQSRAEAVVAVVDSLYHQADEIWVYLNDYEAVPEGLKRPKVKAILDAPDLADRSRFLGTQDFTGYAILCDDDILYPPYYVDHLIDGIERYGRQAVVGWHGSLLGERFQDFYDPRSRRVITFSEAVAEDTPVHILGTGCCGYHTGAIQFALSDFPEPCMSDMTVARLAQRRDLSLIVLAHDGGEAQPIEVAGDSSIYAQSLHQTGGHMDTRALKNRWVTEEAPWRLPPVIPAWTRDRWRVLVVGKLEAERWKPGGVFRSGHMLIDSLRVLGHSVVPVDLEDAETFTMGGEAWPDLAVFYPGGPAQPNFASAEALLLKVRAKGVPCLVNPAHNGTPERTAWLKERLRAWNEGPGAPVRAMLFTHAAAADPVWGDLSPMVMAVPKTINIAHGLSARFEQTSGIFLGDLQKLLDQTLTLGPIDPWLDAVQAVLPGVDLLTVRQHGGEMGRELGVQVLPPTSGLVWEQFLAARRLVCCLTPGASYEMVPVEAAAMGVPVVYRPMTHAHTEGLSLCGVQVTSPEHFAQVCYQLYTDQTLWMGASQAAHHRGQSQLIGAQRASLHLHLQQAMAPL